jgi:hypothetical protein
MSPGSYLSMAASMFHLFAATRITSLGDRAELTRAARHGTDACRLNPSDPDVWSLMALIYNRQGRYPEAIAAAKKAVSLAPTNGLHYLHLAVVSWGEERIRAAHRALVWNPEIVQAHWLAATVFIARGRLVEALSELRDGCAKHDAQTLGQKKVDSPGLHWLHGLVLLALGVEKDAHAEFECEIMRASDRYVEGREAIANSAYALGAVALRAALEQGATPGSAEALAGLPAYPMIVSGTMSSTPGAAELTGELHPVESAMVKAARLGLYRQHQEAARGCREALVAAPPGGAGWLLPVDPLVNTNARADIWAAALLALRQRAM